MLRKNSDEVMQRKQRNNTQSSVSTSQKLHQKCFFSQKLLKFGVRTLPVVWLV